MLKLEDCFVEAGIVNNYPKMLGLDEILNSVSLQEHNSSFLRHKSDTTEYVLLFCSKVQHPYLQQLTVTLVKVYASSAQPRF